MMNQALRRRVPGGAAEMGNGTGKRALLHDL